MLNASVGVQRVLARLRPVQSRRAPVAESIHGQGLLLVAMMRRVASQAVHVPVATVAALRPPSRARGRDIGTIVCPAADVKLFITASTEARAARRVKELREQGTPAIYDNVLQDLNERDARDSSRRAAPLTAAHDAHIVDTTTLDADVVFERVSSLVARALEEKEWQQ